MSAAGIAKLRCAGAQDGVAGRKAGRLSRGVSHSCILSYTFDVFFSILCVIFNKFRPNFPFTPKNVILGLNLKKITRKRKKWS